MAHLEIRALHKRFGQFTALNDIELDVDKGEFVVLLGPSGCGKTTLLRTIAGLEFQDGGRIVHAGQDISRLPAAKRDYGIVFQSYALFPNLSVADNVAYGLRANRHNKHLIGQRIEEMLALVGLPGTQEKYPAQLSGGQQQRIALARALATSPDLLLLDEPLSALDAIERVRLRGEIRNLQKRLGVTTLMVTHDQEEALAMADRVIVMQGGRIEQVGDPKSIYSQPANAFVADFIGRANVLAGTAGGDGTADFGGLRLRYNGQAGSGPARFYVRPEDIRLCEILDHTRNSFYAQVRKAEFLGSYSLVTVVPDAAPALALQVQFATNYLRGREIHPGALLRLAIPPDTLLPFPETA